MQRYPDLRVWNLRPAAEPANSSAVPSGNLEGSIDARGESLVRLTYEVAGYGRDAEGKVVISF